MKLDSDLFLGVAKPTENGQNQEHKSLSSRDKEDAGKATLKGTRIASEKS